MFKLLHTSLIVFILSLPLIANAQQPVLVVKSFEYIWQRNFGDMSVSAPPHIIILSDDSAKLLLNNIFARAIQNRWNMVLPELSVSVKPLSVWANTPKFNTRLKDKEPNKWYLFLQVFDKGNFPDFSDEDTTLSTILELRCSLVSGTNNSVILDRSLTVNIYREPVPADQVLLTRLPAYPASFMRGFDSIATWLFQSQPISQTSLKLKPACVFQATTIKDVPLTQLLFKTDNDSIHHLTAPAFSFHTPGPKYELIDAKKNIGGNAAGGALTLLTGIHTNKSRLFKYKADFPFEDGDSIYHCLIGYVEKETSERERERINDNGTKISSVKSTNDKFLSRYTDPAFLNVVILGEDTLATFSISYAKEAPAHINYKQVWDGTDSTTIIALPPDWNNKEEETNVIISGKMNSDSFSMKTLKETRIKEFSINDQLVTIMHGSKGPIRAFVFHSISPRQLKLFTILCSLPYSYFNESHSD